MRKSTLDEMASKEKEGLLSYVLSSEWLLIP